MTKLFVGGLPYSINNQGLQQLFEQFGEVISAQVVNDKFSGQSKGFGFVEMSDDNAAQEAIKNLNESMLENRKLGVSVARPKEDRPSNGGGYNGGHNNNFRDNRGGGGRDDFRGGRGGGGRR